ncbi:hypothetical protein TK0100 [Thermococcus kodakarensis KOD1]|uniref:Uncharacterized protein n=1 Tax=Thermococcus kodakarensis (strain ATCC BAA-918 / JCM 12380 / KOD1) TaxID=69014 RepID=Q5JEI6_THEKO|nr:hypothetical protein [Thermococcus kodakarensis]WCN28214.1 hypothetical protein POG15_00530 [Thermococcus kodakarensis]WCN30511.1 hypothetical protein POG21_00530 [Thermococcus kodakarensis]BAD84289.1 hypothetical protein TK0100 [Thermococcus kodakarensis KOD1]
MNSREVWVKLGEGGLHAHKTNVYAVVRKLKRGGYSFRIVERGFNGYTVSTKTERYESLEALFAEVSPRDLYRALQNHPEPDAKEVWAEELELLKKLLEKPAEKKTITPTRQATLAEVLS